MQEMLYIPQVDISLYITYRVGVALFLGPAQAFRRLQPGNEARVGVHSQHYNERNR